MITLNSKSPLHEQVYSTLFEQLSSLLREHQWLWQPRPFEHIKLPWSEIHPSLYKETLQLTEAQLQQLKIQPEANDKWLLRHLPELSRMRTKLRLLEQEMRKPINRKSGRVRLNAMHPQAYPAANGIKLSGLWTSFKPCRGYLHPQR